MDPLSFVAIAELDKNQQLTIPWIFPSLPAGLTHTFLYSRSFLIDTKQAKYSSSSQTKVISHEPPEFLFSRYSSIWLYTYTFKVDASERQDILLYSDYISITLGSKNFFPERYLLILKSFADQFIQSHGKTTDILSSILNLSTQGSITPSSQPFQSNSKSSDNQLQSQISQQLSLIPLSEAEIRKSYQKTPLLSLIKLFGPHSTLLWHGVITKKNILIKVKKEENELNSDEAGNDGKV
ncbi:MAG: hypothetical protein EZS28_018256, partial [Streblomastix strix]